MVSCAGHMNWSSRLALSMPVSGRSPRRGLRWHLISDAPVFLRFSDRLRSRAIRSAYQSSSSPVVIHFDRLEPAPASRRKRMAGSAATTCFADRSGKLPTRFHLPLLTKYHDALARSRVKRRYRPRFSTSRRSRSVPVAWRLISASVMRTAAVMPAPSLWLSAFQVS
ncbi:hypothetical protein ALQ50_200106 [Pseudomonas coronafaciens pv. coronafaciens]|nr:hypothetical protein ALQ50_200106 [Pseudomonas coronafaciens pv. coronafaciens]